MTQQKNTQGGARPGAGRKPTRGVAKVTLSLRVTPDVKAYHARDGNISESIEEQTRNTTGFKQWIKARNAIDQ